MQGQCWHKGRVFCALLEALVLRLPGAFFPWVHWPVPTFMESFVFCKSVIGVEWRGDQGRLSSCLCQL
jgi:hypothetical protein